MRDLWWLLIFEVLLRTNGDKMDKIVGHKRQRLKLLGDPSHFSPPLLLRIRGGYNGDDRNRPSEFTKKNNYYNDYNYGGSDDFSQRYHNNQGQSNHYGNQGQREYDDREWNRDRIEDDYGGSSNYRDYYDDRGRQSESGVSLNILQMICFGDGIENFDH